MASPRRIYEIYRTLHRDAATVRDFQVAAGETVSGTVTLLLSGDRAKPLARWGEEMAEMCGVLAGVHDDPFILESTQVFYWASLYAVLSGRTWESLRFNDLRQQAVTARIENAGALQENSVRLAALGPDKAKPEKLFLFWWAGYLLHCEQRDVDDRWTVEQIMEADLAEMKKRPYLRPILGEVVETTG